MIAAREGRAAGSPSTLLLTALLVVVAPGPRALFAQQDAFSLEGLIVTASPLARAADAVAGNVTVLDGDRLRSAGVRTVADALRAVAGASIVRGGSFGAVTSLFLRGAESDHTLVLVDGVQLNQAGGGFDFAQLDIENVERIEIVRGPNSSLYGSDALSGVIHVITRAGRGAPRTTAALEAGSHGGRRGSVGFEAGTDRAGYAVTLSRATTDGLLERNNQAELTTLSGQARFLPDERTTLAVGLRVTDREYHYPTDGSGAIVDDNAFTYGDGVAAHASVLRGLTSRLRIEARVGLNETDGGTDDAPDGPADTLGFYGFTSLDDFRRATGELRAHLSVGPTEVTLGFEHESERQRSFTESLSEFGPSSGRSENARDNQGYFVHLAGGTGAVAFSAGGRLDDNERFGRSATWNAGLSWSPGGETGTLVRAAAGTGIKEPTFFENYATGFATGNPDLEPERSRSWEVGLEQRLISEILSVRATFFDQRLRDLIQYTFTTPNPGDPNYYNVAEASARGLEMELSGSLGAFAATASWSWLRTEVRDAGFDSGAGATFVTGEELLRRPGHTAAVRAAWVRGRFDASATVRHVGVRADRDFSTFPATPVDLDEYQTVDLATAWRVPVRAGGAALTLQARAENLLDAGYEEVFGFGAPGRALHLGLSVSF